MNRRDRAWANGARAVREEYAALFAKYSDHGYAAPLGSTVDRVPALMWATGVDVHIKMVLIDAGWKAGQDKLRADLDERLAEVSP